MKKPMKSLLGLIVLGVVTASGLWAWSYYVGLPRNFGEVAPGRLYRSGQGSEPQLRHAIERYHLKSIICLRKVQGDGDPRWFRQEKDLARRMGVNFIYQPMTADTLGDEKVWIKLLEIAQDPASGPVLVHCAQGELRTGFFCALYRQIIDGWSWEKAIAEMERFGYDLKSHQTAVALLKQIDIQGARAALQKACSQPAKQP